MNSLSLVSTFFGYRGRITRSDWFWRLLLMALFCIAFGGLAQRELGDAGSGVFALVYLVSSLAQSARRLHDVGRSGAWLLMMLVPVFGPVWVLIQLFRRGAAHENRYGPDPASHADYFKVDIAR